MPRRIRVNTLSPGLTNTPILSRDIGIPPAVRDQVAKSFLAQIPMGRLGEAKDLAKAGLFLASEDSSYVVGAEARGRWGTRATVSAPARRRARRLGGRGAAGHSIFRVDRDWEMRAAGGRLPFCARGQDQAA